MFRQYKKLSLNFGNVPIGDKGADYILGNIPNGVEELNLYFDSVGLSNDFGSILGGRLSLLTSLKKLKVSLILCGMKDEGFSKFFKHHLIGSKIEDL